MIKFNWQDPTDIHPKALHKRFIEAGGQDIGAYDYYPRDGWYLTVDGSDIEVVKSVLLAVGLSFEAREVSSRFD